MHSSLFFKLFPPPKYMLMKHAGLAIADDSIRCLEFKAPTGTTVISKYGCFDIPPGLLDGGVIKDEKAFSSLLHDFEHAHNLSYVKVSIPEEKSYLFQTEVPTRDVHLAAQNIEFKLEENVPLSAADSVFYFDYLPNTVNGVLRVSVSVVPRLYIEQYLRLLREVGMYPIAFEVVPKAIARAVIPAQNGGAVMLVYIMKKNTGIYVVSNGVVCFTSTLAWGTESAPSETGDAVSPLMREINRVMTYWSTHNLVDLPILKLLLIGRDSVRFEEILRQDTVGSGLVVGVADTWQNSLNLEHYVPPISHEESLDYAAVAGLAMGI